MTLNLGMQHWLLDYYQMYTNVDTGLILTYLFTCITYSNLVSFVFVLENAYVVNFQQTIEDCQVKVDIYS